MLLSFERLFTVSQTLLLMLYRCPPHVHSVNLVHLVICCQASTADEDEIIRLQAEIRHLKTLVNQTVAMDSRGNSLIGTPEDKRISTSRAGKRRNQITSPTDDVDTGMTVSPLHCHLYRPYCHVIDLIICLLFYPQFSFFNDRLGIF